MHDRDARPTSQLAPLASDSETTPNSPETHSGHSMWWMVACCAPMVLIALALALGDFATH